MASKTYSNTRILVECALMIALGTVLGQIKIFEMPYGGSVTLLSMLPFVMVSFRHGVKWGMATGFVDSLLQMLLGFYMPPAGTVLAVVGMVLLDYVLAFSVLGLASALARPFKNRTLAVGMGTAGVCVLRFLCSFLSGALLWGSYQSYYDWANGLSVWTYSLVYNASYMLPELLLTTVAAVLLYRAAPQLFAEQYI
jgi:thiamine transporter